MLETERAKDEIRDIMNRMIGAHIRYARMGYWGPAAAYLYTGAASLVKKGVKHPDFPYKRIVMCLYCGKPLYGSASRGKLGNTERYASR